MVYELNGKTFVYSDVLSSRIVLRYEIPRNNGLLKVTNT